jgi:tetratricopeptide (TPR) repeat protein
MVPRTHLLLATLLATAWSTAAPAAAATPDPVHGADRLLHVQRIAAEPGRGREALGRLERLPLAECQSMDYQMTLACAARDAGAASQAAEAVATITLLPARLESSTIGIFGHELTDLRAWLTATGESLYCQALSASATGDLKVAVKSYLVAIKCDQALLARDDRGLAKLGLQALRRMSERQPERPDLQFQLGYYSYLMGDIRGAVDAFEAHSRVQPLAYDRWRGALWLAAARAELGRLHPRPR